MSSSHWLFSVAPEKWKAIGNDKIWVFSMDFLNMNDQTFSNQISAWIDPTMLIKAGIRYDKERERALEPVFCGFPTENLDSAREGGLFELVSKFLENFEIQDSYIKTLKAMATVELSEDAWGWLEDLTFGGEVLELDKKDQSSNKGALLAIRERDSVVDILIQPIELVTNLVDSLSKHWKETKSMLNNHLEKSGDPSTLKDKAYLLHSSPGPLGVYIEAQVIKSYGFANSIQAGVALPAEYNIMNEYRAVTIIGKPPFEQKILETVKEVAIHQGNLTQKW